MVQLRDLSAYFGRELPGLEIVKNLYRLMLVLKQQVEQKQCEV